MRCPESVREFQISELVEEDQVEKMRLNRYMNQITRAYVKEFTKSKPTSLKCFKQSSSKTTFQFWKTPSDSCVKMTLAGARASPPSQEYHRGRGRAKNGSQVSVISSRMNGQCHSCDGKNQEWVGFKR